uniref:Uncharacterized protein LOC113793720 n=1 Tax=Dermatophagoides pteronyssinus TaxID=6956 RepID=A0A6P6Y563_DERPT
MISVPDELKKKLTACRRSVSRLTDWRWDIERAEALRTELRALNDELFDLIPENEEVPSEIEEKVEYYNVKLDRYINRLKSPVSSFSSSSIRNDNAMSLDESSSSMVRNEHINVNLDAEDGDNVSHGGRVNNSDDSHDSVLPNDLGQNFANLSLSNTYRPIKTDQLPSFDGKYANWNSYKIMIENLLIKNDMISEDLKKSMLLKTVKNEPERIMSILIGQRLSLTEIWSKICAKFNDPQRAILEIKNDLKLIPKIESENE